MPSVESVPPCTLRAPPHRHQASSRLLPLVSPSACLRVTRQGASAFNQPLSLDTSSVTSMYVMFYVRNPMRVPCPAVGSSVHRRRRRPPLRFPPPVSPSTFLGVTRQGASAFNQPLSLDTSSVMDMQSMFRVRTPERVPCPAVESVPPCTLRACTVTPPPCPLAPPTARVAVHVPRCDSAGSVNVQPATELRHVQRHNHG